MAGIGKAVKFISKKAGGKAIAAIRNAKKAQKAATKEIEVLQKAGPKQASGLSKTGKQLNQSAKEAQQAKLTRQHQAKIDRLQGKIDEAKAAKKEGWKTLGKRTAVGAGIVGVGTVNQAQKQSMQKRISELEAKQKTATKVNPPQQQENKSTETQEEKKQESTNTTQNNNTSSNRSTSGGSRTSSSRGRVRVPEGYTQPTRRTSSGGVHVVSNRKAVESVKLKESGKTDRYRIKQEEKTKRTKIRQEEMTKRQTNRQNKKTERQAKRQNKKSNRRKNS